MTINCLRCNFQSKLRTVCPIWRVLAQRPYIRVAKHKSIGYILNYFLPWGRKRKNTPKMKHLLFILYFTLLLFLAFACATYKKQYSKSGRDWADPPLPSSGPSHVMYLVGDAGNSMPGGSTSGAA